MEPEKNKTMSARKIIALVITYTYCAMMLGATVLTIIKIIDIPVFLGIFSSFTTLVLAIINSYFNKDRKNGGK